MRIVWALLIWGVFTGGLTFYMQQRDTVAGTQPAAITLEKAPGRYFLNITTTFAAEPDPFALTTGDEPPAALLVRLGSNIVMSKADGIKPGIPMQVALADGLTVGSNEIFVQASPPLRAESGAQAVRVQILKDDIVLKEQTFWAAPGENVAESMRFDIEVEKGGDGHDH